MEQQGEAIGYSLDGKSLVTTSEGAPCPVSVVKISGQSSEIARNAEKAKDFQR
jgi:hypothetical protein